jgi:hypothetical protein
LPGSMASSVHSYLSKLRRDSVGADFQSVRKLTNYVLSAFRKLPQKLPQQAQTIESISGHTYIRKRISLTFFVKKLILWSERLFQGFLSDATCFVCRAVTFFNEIEIPLY